MTNLVNIVDIGELVEHGIQIVQHPYNLDGLHCRRNVGKCHDVTEQDCHFGKLFYNLKELILKVLMKLI